VKFIVSIDQARIPGDSLRFLANRVLSDFVGEKTILAPATASSILGLTTLTVLDEATGFGKVKVFDPSAPVALRPRLRLVVLPASNQ
jgi:hypothetical protein